MSDVEFKILSILVSSIFGRSTILSKITYQDFVDEKNKILFKSVYELFSEGKDVNSTILINYLEEKKQLSFIGTQYLLKLFSDYVSDYYLENYLEIVIEKSSKIKLAKIADLLQFELKQKNKNSKLLVSLVSEKLDEISAISTTDNLEILGHVSDEVLKNLEWLKEGHEPEGLKLGYTEIDRMTSGLQNGDLVIMAARPSMGKTALALNMAYNVARNKSIKNNGVVFFSLEMPSKQLASRILSLSTEVDMQKLRNVNEITIEEWRDLKKSNLNNSKIPMYLDDTPGLTIMQLQTKMKKLIIEHPNIGLLVIDYLQLLSSDLPNSSRQQEISKISRQLKILARQLDIPILCLSQLSRSTEKREDKRPIMSDLRDSGSIEQDADLVLLLFRNDYYQEKNNNENDPFASATNNDDQEIEIIFAKNRNGPTGVAKLNFTKKCGLFTDR